MAEIKRTAEAFWQGDLKGGKGQVSTHSGALNKASYTWSTRFEQSPGTNPEELIAAAHAGCFTMALSSALTKKNMAPESLHTNATLTMDNVNGQMTVTKMSLVVEGKVPNMDQAAFQQTAEDAEKGCPISRLLRPGLKDVEVVAKLLQTMPEIPAEQEFRCVPEGAPDKSSWKERRKPGDLSLG